jgi:signal transduction histidine kinase
METYSPYSLVDERTGEVWRDFATITMVSLLVLVLLLLPVLWRLLQRLRRAQVQRETLLERAVNASTDERRRIAAGLHDGLVQDLVGASLVVSGAAYRAQAEGRDDVAEELRGAAASVRTGIVGLRSLLVDIYPPSLTATGLEDALDDLATSTEMRHIDVHFQCSYPDRSRIGQDGERLVFQIAQECLRNTVRHASATVVQISLAPDRNTMVLDIDDDGVGFDVQAALQKPEEGHFGLRLMAETAAQNNAELRVASSPGSGTRWQLRVPTCRADQDQREAAPAIPA